MKLALAAINVLLWSLMAHARLVFDAADDKQYPVTKVVTLLKDMQAQLEKEAEEDEEVYDKMACWCKTNDREKTVSIKDAEARISDLTTTIESTSAESGRLKVEIANHEKDLAKNEKSLADLTAIREKQADEFNGEEKDMLQSIKALQSAVVVLSKHHGGGAVLMDDSTMNIISGLMRKTMTQHESLLQGVITPHQKKVILGSFMQLDRSQLRQPAAKFKSYTPASSEIFGILKQMKETFETNLSDSQKDELANAKAFEEQKAAKNEEIKAVSASLNQKRSHLAKADETNAQAKEDIEDTRNALSIDDKFLMDLKERCKMTDEEWGLRQKARQEEITAIVEAISILSADEAHDNFSKTFNPAASFVQRKATQTHRRGDARQKAAEVLKAVAAKTGNPALSGLAVAAELDAFTKVKAAIDKMVAELLKQQEAEVKQKDFCVDKLNENELSTEKKTRSKMNSETKIAGLETTIKEVSTALETLKQEIAEMNIQIKRLGEDRELENRDFQSTVADQRETQKLLNKALTVLKAVFIKQQAKKKGAASFLQQGPPPPPGFKDYQKNAGGGGAVHLLEQILGDAKVMEAEAVKDEQNAQEQYEKAVKDTNDSIEAKQAAIVN
jgi:hypothetical protein